MKTKEEEEEGSQGHAALFKLTDVDETNNDHSSNSHASQSNTKLDRLLLELSLKSSDPSPSPTPSLSPSPSPSQLAPEPPYHRHAYENKANTIAITPDASATPLNTATDRFEFVQEALVSTASGVTASLSSPSSSSSWSSTSSVSLNDTRLG